MKSFVVIIAILVAFTGCVKKNKVPTAEAVANPGMHQVKVEEVVQTSNYTYMKVSENNSDFWIAVGLQEATPGEVYYYTDALEMNNFNSKELNRTFETVYFVNDMSKEPVTAAPAMGDNGMPTKAIQPTITMKEGISVAPAQEGLSIAKLYADRSAYEGKKVKMKGQVTKINNEVMGKNWIHIQDGTADGENFDLTVTTLDAVKMDEVVAFEGTITLKKDFGYGYFYELIMEDATLVK